MNWKKEIRPLFWIITIFILFFYLPVGTKRFDNAIMEALYLARWYAREHVLLCLIPALFIAGAIAVFVGKASIMKYLGPSAKKSVAYSVSSISGSILAVCSCTVLPLFSGIYKMGAGLGPATTFLYAGPAINVLAIILTARVLGLQLGIARAVGAILFSIVIGLLMHLIFRKEETKKMQNTFTMPDEHHTRSLWQNSIYFMLLIAILVFANWSKPVDTSGIWHILYTKKWIITALASMLLLVVLIAWFAFTWWKLALLTLATGTIGFLFPGIPLLTFAVGIFGFSLITNSEQGEPVEWFDSTWSFAKQILPLLFFGVLIAGALLGRPGHEGLIPSSWVYAAVGGNSFSANLLASIAGAFMYFATLTEIPILQGLLDNGMGNGPALALLLAGPALSLPNMLVIRSVMGTKKTIVYVALVIVMSTVSGIIYGALI